MYKQKLIKKNLVWLTLAVISCGFFATEVLPQDRQRTVPRLGGQLFLQHAESLIPATGTRVTLIRHEPRQRAARVFADTDGWFFFYDVPHDVYYLEFHLIDGRRFATGIIYIAEEKDIILAPIAVLPRQQNP